MLRQARGLSQQRVAEAMGLTYQQVQKYEKGLNRISASKLCQLMTYFDVPSSYLFEELTPSSDVLGELHNTESVTPNAIALENLAPNVRRQVLGLIGAIEQASGDRNRN